MWAALLFKTLIKVGKLTFQDARGKVHVFEGLPGPNFAIRSHSLALERRILFTPKLAIGEGYVSGELEITDGSLFEFLDLCMANVRYLDDMPGQGWAEFRRRLIALWRSYNPISLAAPKVRHHYDLKDSLFDLFLDSDRQYSCAYFRTPNDSLAQAQEQKKRHIAAKLCLEDGQKVLDIGSGWGAWRFHWPVTGRSRLMALPCHASSIATARNVPTMPAWLITYAFICKTIARLRASLIGLCRLAC
jgi:cyclopropane-fatty-acyl-phospholipid synthase